MSNDLPYKTEYATTDRASCRKRNCNLKIAKGELRFAEILDSCFHSGKATYWYHEECFFQDYSPSSISEIAGFNVLNNDDQQRIRHLLGEKETNTASNNDTQLSGVHGKQNNEMQGGERATRDFARESQPPPCITGGNKIQEVHEQMENEIPFKKMKKEPLHQQQGTSSFLQEQVVSMEVDGVGTSEQVEKGIKIQFVTHDEFSDKENHIKPKDIVKMDSVNGKELETDRLKNKEEIMKVQNDLFHKFRDSLGLTKLGQILTANGQTITNYSRRKDHLADCMAFGALKPCPKCNGQLVLDTFHYKCIGAGPWGACLFTTRAPHRKPLVIPHKFVNKAAFVNYTPAVAARLFPPAPNTKPQPLKDLEFFIYQNYEEDAIDNDVPQSHDVDNLGVSQDIDDSGISQHIDNSGVPQCIVMSEVSQNVNDSGARQYSDDSFIAQNIDDAGAAQNINDAGAAQNIDDSGVAKNNRDSGVSLNNEDTIVNQYREDTGVSLNNDETDDALSVASRIEHLGGKVCDSLSPGLAAVVWLGRRRRLEEPDSEGVLKQIAQMDIQVVHKSFFDNIDAKSRSVEHTLRFIRDENIATWGSDRATRLGVEKTYTSFRQPRELKLGSVKYKAKGGVVLDRCCWPAWPAHAVRNKRGAPFSAALAKVDVAHNTNAFYKMQLLRSDSDAPRRYWVLFAWGHIGTDQGDSQLLEFTTFKEARAKFCAKFKEKTKNKWRNRANFVKHPKCYYQVGLEWCVSASAPRPRDSAALPHQVQQLVKKIFDIEEMERTLVEFQLDTAKMPLGKIPRKQLMEAYSVLTELLQLVDCDARDQQSINAASNRFYSLVPHSFGLLPAPAIDTVDKIEAKREMLDDLLELQLTYSMCDEGSADIEECYRKLRADIAPLEHDSRELQLLQDYVRTTHAPTHNFTVDIHRAFKVTREGERARYEKYSGLHNRRLLWHGSRLTNYAGILAQGLRIAPREAPVTGYMFGKGVYFADVVSKAAQYCHADHGRPQGLMLLCEVALGTMKEYLDAEYVSRLPAGVQSVRGVGRLQPDPGCARRLPDGTLVPLGPLVPTDRLSDLLYNEFVVYNVAQVNVKYLLQMKFNFK